MNSKKYFKKNNDVAFHLTVKMLTEYAKKCEKDPHKKVMDPVLGSYFLMHQLAIALFFKAEGFEEDLTDLMQDAINDAKDIVKKSRKVS
tara:strand:- start:843 stop:1109 length:267 start_codon:yes stop_codon:yes gene_type:complete